jgi:hypothetical protein
MAHIHLYFNLIDFQSVYFIFEVIRLITKTIIITLTCYSKHKMHVLKASELILEKSYISNRSNILLKKLDFIHKSWSKCLKGLFLS